MRAIGVDLGGTNLRAARIDLNSAKDEGYTIEQLIKEPLTDKTPEGVAKHIAKRVGDLGNFPIGIGVAGMLRGTSGVVANAPNLGWIDVPFGEILEKEIGRPVWLENDVSSIAWGSYRFGVAKGRQSVLCVVVGTGVGAGAVLNGNVYRGASGASMEIGHVKVEVGGRLCGCGQRGCLEAYAGGRHITEQALESPSDLLLKLVDNNPDWINPYTVQRAKNLGDSKCTEIFNNAVKHLGLVLSNSITMLNCDSLVTGGTVWDRCTDLMCDCIDIIKKETNFPAYEELKSMRFQSSEIGTVGAADLAIKELSK